ncbi:MAG: hypothetical protein AAF604_21610 [Acidobacteriota bacterium]
MSATPGDRLWRALPLLLLATIVVLGMVIEGLRFGHLDWPTKLPVGLLLVLVLFPPRR